MRKNQTAQASVRSWTILQALLCTGLLIGCAPSPTKSPAPSTKTSSNVTPKAGSPVTVPATGYDGSGTVTNPDVSGDSEGVTPPGNISGSTAVTSGKRYVLKNVLSLKCLGVKDKSNANAAPMVLQTCNDDASQKFEVRASGAYMIFTNMSSLKVLELRDKQTEEGTIVQQGDSFGEDTQLFQLFPDGDGSFHIRSKAASRYIDVKNRSDDDGATIHIWDFRDQENQSWLFLETN